MPSERLYSLGVISLSWSLSGKANTLVQLVISAQDGGGLQAQPNARVNISIVEGTVSPPIFEQAQYFFTVPEDILQGTNVGAVRAQNPPGMGLALLYAVTFRCSCIVLKVWYHTSSESNPILGAPCMLKGMHT